MRVSIDLPDNTSGVMIAYGPEIKLFELYDSPESFNHGVFFRIPVIIGGFNFEAREGWRDVLFPHDFARGSVIE